MSETEHPVDKLFRELDSAKKLIFTPLRPSEKARGFLGALAETRCPNLSVATRERLITAVKDNALSGEWASDFIAELKHHEKKWRPTCARCSFLSSQ